MEKVKIFSKEDYVDLEYVMNHWLSVCDVKIFDVKYTTVFNVAKNVIIYSAMVIYRTEEDLNNTTQF